MVVLARIPKYPDRVVMCDFVYGVSKAGSLRVVSIHKKRASADMLMYDLVISHYYNVKWLGIVKLM